MKKKLDKLIGRFLPTISVGYRKLRDYRQFHNAEAPDSGFGFTLAGDNGLSAGHVGAPEVPVLTKLLEAADAFVDVGANVGFYTCVAAKLQKPCLTVEPHPYNLHCLYRNIRENHLTGVEVYPIALSDRANVMTLHGGGQGASLMKGYAGIIHNYEFTVPVNTLDNVLGNRFIEKRLVIKVDVEGHEWEVLNGAARTINSTLRPSWIVEISLTENMEDGVYPRYEEVFDLFWRAGYECWSLIDPFKQVTQEDVRRWIKQQRRDFGTCNYVFLECGLQLIL